MTNIESDIVGRIINNYLIIKQLGEGKFSKVYQAECQYNKVLVALKVIKVIQNYV